MARLHEPEILLSDSYLVAALAALRGLGLFLASAANREWQMLADGPASDLGNVDGMLCHICASSLVGH